MEVVPPRMKELEQLELKHSSKKGATANILAAAPFVLEYFSSNCIYTQNTRSGVKFRIA